MSPEHLGSCRGGWASAHSFRGQLEQVAHPEGTVSSEHWLYNFQPQSPLFLGKEAGI